MNKVAKTIAIILVSLLGLLALGLNLMAFLVGNGSLGSSVQEKAVLIEQSQKEVAHEIYKQSCKGNLTIDEFAQGKMTLADANTCNGDPYPNGIRFIGGNGNEMYLLSHYNWDVRVLYATYYLLQRGFDGPEQYSMRMDCSPPGFKAKPKMTLGVHYKLQGNSFVSYIQSIQNPQPNMNQEYLPSIRNPEGTEKYNIVPALSPHAFGQALDVYQYGCTSVYVRLDSQETADRWACGYSQSTGTTVHKHSYIFPIKNIPIEISYINSNSSISTRPENGWPDAHERYLLSPKPGLDACNKGSIVSVTVGNVCSPPNSPIITYQNAGCIAQNQPDNGSSYYNSRYYYNGPRPGYYSDESRVQPFQFMPAAKIHNPWDSCRCVSAGVGNDIPQSEQPFYQNKLTPFTFLNPILNPTIPAPQQKNLDNGQVRTYVTSQAERSRKIILEAAMLFSVREQNDAALQEADTLFKNLVGVSRSDIKKMEMNQIVSPNTGNYQYPPSYLDFARILFLDKKTPAAYRADLLSGHKNGLGYYSTDNNSTDNDRIHLGF
jgi:hypothetical protein